jgi:hypothetical protein
MKESVTIEVITSKERNEIAGRYALVGKSDGVCVVGTVGSLWPHDLNRRQRNFIAHWYFHDTSAKYKFEVLESYPESALPQGNFNEFLKITKEV